MSAALIAGIFGFAAVVLKSFESWVGPRRQRELLKIELELYDKAKSAGLTEPTDHLSILIRRRTAQWSEALTPKRVWDRRGNVLFLFGTLGLFLCVVVQQFSVGPGPAWWTSIRGPLRQGLFFVGTVLMSLAAGFFIWAARAASVETKAKQQPSATASRPPQSGRGRSRRSRRTPR